MTTNLQSAWSRSVIGRMTVAMLLVGGCGVEPIQTPTFSSSTTSTTPPPAPVKYSSAGLKSCPDIQQTVSAALPPPMPEDNQQGPKWSVKKCAFRSDDSLVVLSIQYWETTDDITGIHTGTERAKKDFLDGMQGNEKDRAVGFGSDARWRDNDTTGCTLEILDENAVLTAHSGPRKTIVNGDIEQCRGRVRELAKQFYTAVQPQ